MAKPWARYEVRWIKHDKFKALPANAICLWVEGKDYADDNLTDGLLPLYVVKHFRFFSKRNIDLLLKSIGAKHAGGGDVYAPLWEPHPLGYKMHDYLDHNECREEALARIAVGRGNATEDQKRIAATARQRKKRERDKRVTVGVT